VPFRILLIDDEPNVRKTVAGMLAVGGHDVAQAASGPEGLALLAARPVDIVFTDLNMGGMTGWEVAQHIRTKYAEVSIVLLSGWPEPREGREHLDKLVDLIIEKPVRLKDLHAALAALDSTRVPAEKTRWGSELCSPIG
jgi:CheY-like chemotaxis protein